MDQYINYQDYQGANLNQIGNDENDYFSDSLKDNNSYNEKNKEIIQESQNNLNTFSSTQNKDFFWNYDQLKGKEQYTFAKFTRV